MSFTEEVYHLHRVKERAALCRASNSEFAQWAAGYGEIRHSDLTQVRVYEMADFLVKEGRVPVIDEVFVRLRAADRLASAAMWLVVHMAYARNVYLDGRELSADDFKEAPEGHTGGALNMVIAYSGYLAVNTITNITRSWLMGQGHCVAGVDSANLLVANMTPAHAERYGLSDEELTRFVRDFYLYEVTPDGRPVSPLGSHVNAHTAGGLIEGGYLGFAELYYVHMPLPGERLVAFLSDGAFEEQKGGDWAPRWWRAQDSGLVAPIMIANGRRIDQRTTVSMQGGVDWFRDHLRLNGFEPIDIDGSDPAAFAWAIWEMEQRLSAHGRAVQDGRERYPVPLPYAIAEVEKGFGFPGAGTNASHNLPIGDDTRTNPTARRNFNDGARRLWVPLDELKKVREILANHADAPRPLERDNAIAVRRIKEPEFPEVSWRSASAGNACSPMSAVDEFFLSFVRENPHLRCRVGNPDEVRSNRLERTLEMLKHRVTDPEPDVTEAVDGKIITALNEEAVICAALANKGGINLVASYEAFAVKMLGAIRQEIIFSRHLREAGRPPQWLSVPVIATSHTWENGKNEQSHQDPTLCEALMGEMSDVSRVIFPADANSAVAALEAAYHTRGGLWNLVIPKRSVTDRFSGDDARRLVRDGALAIKSDDNSRILLVAVGAYQLEEVLSASARLDQRGVPHSVICVIEPARFRQPRDPLEHDYVMPEEKRQQLFAEEVPARVFLVHGRPEVFLGVMRPLDTGQVHTRALGYISRGGTFDAFGMLFANRCTWGHVLAAAADVLGTGAADFLSPEELRAVNGQGEPQVLAVPPGTGDNQ